MYSVCMCYKNRLISLAKSNHCSALILGSVQVPSYALFPLVVWFTAVGGLQPRSRPSILQVGWRGTHWLGTIKDYYHFLQFNDLVVHITSVKDYTCFPSPSMKLQLKIQNTIEIYS